MCEDNIRIPAHKVIIATASNVIKHAIKTNSGPNRILSLHMPSATLQEIVRFIYTGKCQINPLYLDKFLKDAVQLQIKGISFNFLKEGVKEP